MANEYKTITEKEGNLQDGKASKLSDIAYLKAMDSEGTPKNITPEIMLSELKGLTFTPYEIEFNNESTKTIPLTSSDGVLDSVNSVDVNPIYIEGVKVKHQDGYAVVKGNVYVSFDDAGIGSIYVRAHVGNLSGEPYTGTLHITRIDYNNTTYYPEATAATNLAEIGEEISELSQKVEDLDEDCVHKTTVEDVEYDGSVDGKPVAELKVALNKEIADRESADTTLQGNIDKKADKEHTHTKSEITDFSHTHTKSEITDFEHTHDDRYYTEEEMDTKLSGKQDTISDLAQIRSNASAGAALVGHVPYVEIVETLTD